MAMIARILITSVGVSRGDTAMAQEPQHLAGLESAAQFFGVELRHWRTLRGLSQHQLGQRTHDSGALIGKIEKAQRRPTLPFAQRMDQALATAGALERLWARLDSERRHQESREDPKDPVSTDLGLGWAPSPTLTETVIDLWRADMHRRAVIASAAWSAAAFATPARRWLEDPADADVARPAGAAGGRRVGKADVDALWAMASSFAAIDHTRGGGYARSTLTEFLAHVVAPILEGTYDDTTGRQLYSAAARLADLAGFMAFDSGRHGLAQRYFIQALRLAKAADNKALGAHILTDMSMQAHHLGRDTLARDLAGSGRSTAKRAGSRSLMARAAALEARALGSSGEASAATAALAFAERDLGRATVPDEPLWIQFFTEAHLAVERVYVAHELGDSRQVQRFASDLDSAAAGEMNRRQVLAATTLAGSYLPVSSDQSGPPTRRPRPGPRGGEVDVDQACAVLIRALPSAAGLTSSRGLEAINGLRRRLAPYQQLPAVQQVEHDVAAFVGS